MSAKLARSVGRIGARVSALGFAAASIAAMMLTSTAVAGNPAEEMAKASAATPADPRAAALDSIQRSLFQFAHPEFLLRLLIGFSLAVACSWFVAWHPRRSTRLDPLTDLEERKALIILGMVGAIVAELSGSSQSLAFVIFGIGALLRFRTVLDNPKLTGKAITVVVIGLACGSGSWAMAVFVTLFSWLLIFWLDSHVSCRIKIRLDGRVDPQPLYGEVQELLVSRHCRLRNSIMYETKRQMVFLVHMPSSLDPKHLESDIRAKLPKSEGADIEMRVL